MYDEEPEDPHGECNEEIRRLEAEIRDLHGELRSMQAEISDLVNTPCDCR